MSSIKVQCPRCGYESQALPGMNIWLCPMCGVEYDVESVKVRK